MAEVKNSFLKSKMNKDLDDRLIPNGEYRDALNITVNKSDGEDVGTAQVVRGNIEVIDFNTVTSETGLQVVGLLPDDSLNSIFAFVTNNTGEAYDEDSYSAIISWRVDSANTTAKIIVEGNWLNFSTLYPITGINLLEELLFFTDNRNQPRKVNINKPVDYYDKEDQISVAKYYPHESIILYRPSEETGSIVATTTTTAASTTNVIEVTSVSNIAVGQGVLLASGSSTEVLRNTFVTSVNATGLEVTVNQNVNVASGATLNFVSAETTMQDAISEYLPVTGEGEISIETSTTQYTIQDYNGYVNIVGDSGVGGIQPNLYLKNAEGKWIDTNAKVTVFDKDENNGGFKITTDVDPNIAVGDEVLIAIPNPYYDENFAEQANIDYLEDKFVRFSYRFKFDDGEHSLIAPFTQPCFIPKQDGYFLDASFNDNTTDPSQNLSDFATAYQSTEVSFMENKVNKVVLNVPLPYTAGNMASELKIEEIEILYKESDEVAIKVVDAIPVSNLSGNDYYFQYEYGSKSPYKSLPEKENTRVYDKVPVKALSQEIISNRVVYGNYQDKHTPPNFLDYNIAVTPKYSFSPNVNDTGTSKIEYPNANVKQNRNYEIGIVLSDRFGRQSTVILSESTFNNLPSYLASTIYSPFRGEDDQSGSTTFDGDSLKVTFNDFIPSTYEGSPGLYNGDKTSSDYNPLGWYSYKIVVKQVEQDYYNAYVAPIMQGYPTDNDKEKFDTSHISLFGDNINKIPRDLAELGPTQKQFRSSVKLWPRVAGDADSTDPFYNSIQFFPKRVGDIASAIGTIEDLFDLPPVPGNFIGSKGVWAETTSYPGYNITFNLGSSPSVEDQALFKGISVGDEVRAIFVGSYDANDPCTILTIHSDQENLPSIFEIEISKEVTSAFAQGDNVGFYRSGSKNYFYNQESDPLIARISTTKQAGVEIPAEYPDFGPSLNIYEVEAQKSLLDIYWETSTSGLISELNQSIADGPGALVYNRTEGWAPSINEADEENETIVSSFRAVLLNGTQITPEADATATIVNVYEQGSPSNTLNLLGNPYADSFRIDALGNGYFDLDIDSNPAELVHTSGNNSLTFEILYEHPNADNSFTDFQDVTILNVDPSINTCPGNQTITIKTQFIYDFTGVNGSSTTSLNQEGLVWSLDNTVTDTTKFTINQDGELRAINVQTPAGTYPIRVVLTDGGGAQDTCDFNVTYNYAPSITWNPNGDQIVNINNTDTPGGGNITVTQTGTVVIANGAYDIKLRGQHQGTTTTSWSTTYNASISSTNFSTATIGAPSQLNETATQEFQPGTYAFSITVVTNGLPASTAGTAQALGSLIATVA